MANRTVPISASWLSRRTRICCEAISHLLVVDSHVHPSSKLLNYETNFPHSEPGCSVEPLVNCRTTSSAFCSRLRVSRISSTVSGLFSYSETFTSSREGDPLRRVLSISLTRGRPMVRVVPSWRSRPAQLQDVALPLCHLLASQPVRRGQPLL